MQEKLEKYKFFYFLNISNLLRQFSKQIIVVLEVCKKLSNVQKKMAKSK